MSERRTATTVESTTVEPTATRPTGVQPDPTDPPGPAAGVPSREPGPGRRTPLMLALPVAVLAAAVVSVHLTRRQFWYDEYATWFVTTLSWSDFTRLLGNIDMVHALYYLVIRGWAALFGDSVLVLRLPSVAGVAVAAGALVLLGRRLCGTAVGVTAGVVYAAIPAVSRFGQEARSYAWVSAAAVLCTLALLRARERHTWPHWLVYGGSLLVLIHLHLVAALIVPAHALLAVRRPGCAPSGSAPASRPVPGAGTGSGAGSRRWWPRGAGWRWVVTAAAAGLLAAPVVYEASTQTGQVAWIRADDEAVLHYLPSLFGSPAVAWAIVPLGLLGAAVLWYTDRGPLPALLAWAVLPPVACYATFSLAHLFLAKYSMFTLPAWALLVAIALVVPLAALRRWLLAVDVGVLVAVAVLAVAAVGLDAQAEIRRSRVMGEPDFRAAAALIDHRYQPGDGIAYAGFEVLGRPRQPMAYELTTAQPRDVFAAAPPASNGWFGAPECRDPAVCIGDPPRIWLLTNTKVARPLERMAPAQAALLGQRYTVTTTDSFPWVDVVLLVHR